MERRGTRNNCKEEGVGDILRHLSNFQHTACSYPSLPERGSRDAVFLWLLSMPLFTQRNKDQSYFLRLKHTFTCFFSFQFLTSHLISEETGRKQPEILKLLQMHLSPCEDAEICERACCTTSMYSHLHLLIGSVELAGDLH